MQFPNRTATVREWALSLAGDSMKMNKSATSSQPEKLVRRSAADIRAYAKSPAAKEASAELRAHIRKHGEEPSADQLSRMYRPVKAPVTVRIDTDILAWLRAKGGPYQTHMNATLRSAMLAERKRSTR